MMPVRRSIPALFLSLAAAAACDEIGPRIASDLRLDVVELTLEPGDTVGLRPEVLGSRGRRFTDAPTTWSSSDTLVVRVDARGLVRAVAWGEAEVTATADDVTVDVDVRVGVRFVAVSAGEFATCALSETGRAYCWGEGPLGVPGT